MDQLHSLFATAHPVFYDQPGRRDVDPSREFRPNRGLQWDTWRSIVEDHWTHWSAPGSSLPDQGWKIHVSTIPRGAHHVLDEVSAYCHQNALTFKHIRSDRELLRVLSKDADRGSSGKFVTIYPDSESALLQCLTTLDELIGGLPGPYILSDLRWSVGPLYVRYGSFTVQYVVHDGLIVPAIRNLTTGQLVPDIREPSFHVPDWVCMPPFLQQQVERLACDRPPNFPAVTRALHHSNSGGIYTARVNDQLVVLKEARPHAGWTADGRDAVTRLKDEEATLLQLPAVVGAPTPLGSFEEEHHRFLMLEHIDGNSLAEIVASRSPLTRSSATRADYERYRDWALTVSNQLSEQITALHEVGRSHGDLHPRNVLVTVDGHVRVIDFEMSLSTSSTTSQVIGVAGFVPPDDRSPVDRDLYALACIELFLFVPLTPLLALDDDKPAQLLRFAQQRFHLTESWVAARMDVLARGRSSPTDVNRHSESQGREASMEDLSISAIAECLRCDSSPDRADRLWPGDPHQYGEARYSLGFGALGIAAALASAGARLTDDQLRWIEEEVGRADERDPKGLMNGMAGAVWGCHLLGMASHAERLTTELVECDWRALDSTLYSGLPGVALTLLSQSHRQPRLADLAATMSEELHQRLDQRAPSTRVGTDRGGLFGGAGGTALLAIRLFEHFADETFLRLARLAIDHDIASLHESADGSLHVNEGWRVVPYLGYGSAGIGLVIAQYLSIANDPGNYRRTLKGIVGAACIPFAVQAGLMHGRAGLIHFLVIVEQAGFGNHRIRSAIVRHTTDLRLHALRDGSGTRFAGNGLLRASCDLASGAAGVLAVLTAPTATLMTQKRPGILSFLASFSPKERFS